MTISWFWTWFSMFLKHDNIMVRHTKIHDTDHEQEMVRTMVFILTLLFSSNYSETPSPAYKRIMYRYMNLQWSELWRFNCLAHDNFMGHTMKKIYTGKWYFHGLNDGFDMGIIWYFHSIFREISWYVLWNCQKTGTWNYHGTYHDFVLAIPWYYHGRNH